MLINSTGWYLLRADLVWNGLILREAGEVLQLDVTEDGMVRSGDRRLPPSAFLLAEPLEVTPTPQGPPEPGGVYVDTRGLTLWSHFTQEKREPRAFFPNSFLYVVPGGPESPEGGAAWVITFEALDGEYRSAYLASSTRPEYRVKDPLYARYANHLVKRHEQHLYFRKNTEDLEAECGRLSKELNQAKFDLSRREAPPPPRPPLTGDPTTDRLFIAAVLREGAWDKHRNQYGLDRDMLLRWAEDAVTREDVEDELKGYFLREIETARKSLAYFPDLSTVEEKCAYKRRPVYAVELTPISPEAVDKALEGVKPEDLPQPVETAPAALIALMTAEPAPEPAKAPAEVIEKEELPDWLLNFGETLTFAVTEYRAAKEGPGRRYPARTAKFISLLWKAGVPVGVPSMQPGCSILLADMVTAAIDAGEGAPLPAWPLRGILDGSFAKTISAGRLIQGVAEIDAEIADLAKKGPKILS